MSSIADAVRARELEARVAVLEQRMAALEQSNNGGALLAQKIGGLQGQINLLRQRMGGEVKADDAA